MLLMIAETAISLLLIGLILLQERESGISGLLGGGGEGGGFYSQRRGLEKIFFVLTMVLTAAFAGLSILELIL